MATLTTARSDSQHRPLGAAPAWTVHAFGATDIGHVRDRNEDHFLIAELTKTLHAQQTSLQQPDVMEAHQHGHLFVVADGMGGHAGGEIASRLATETVEEFMLDALKWFMDLRADDENDEIITKLQDALKEADAEVMRAAEKRPKLQGMGTTLTLAFFLRGELFIAHAGDSRASLFRHGMLASLTRDHTLAAELVRRGELAPKKSRRTAFATSSPTSSAAPHRACTPRSPTPPSNPATASSCAPTASPTCSPTPTSPN